MKAKIAAVVAVLMFPIFFGFVLVTPAQALEAQSPDIYWQKGTIDNKSTTQQWLSETVDPSGFVHISYFDSGLSVLMYATNADGSWETSQIGGTNNGMYSSIASDSSGTVHLAYYDSANNKLNYMFKSGDSWSTPTVIDSGGKYVSLAVEPLGNVHVAYQDANGQKVMYAEKVGGVWSSPVVIDSTGVSGQGISIGVDNSGKSYVSYFESVNSQLRFASNANGNWANEQIAGTGLVAPFTALSINNVSGKVMVIYYDQAHQMLKSVEGSAGAWSTPIGIDAVIGAPFSSIVKDSNLDMNIAYYDKANSTLKYAKYSAGVWTTYIVDSSVYANGVCSIDLDSYDKVHIAYMSASSHLMYVTTSKSMWASAVLETVGNVGGQNAIAVDSAGNTHIVYVDRTNATNPKLMYVTNANGAWQDELISDHAISPAIALSQAGKVYVSFFNNSMNQLNYATNANGNWVINTVDSGQFGTVSSIFVGNNGTLDIAYRGDSSQNLFIAEYVNETRSSIIARDADHIMTTNATILMDSNNKVYVLYTTTAGLKMVTNKEGTWINSVVDPRVVSGLSALIDSSNVVHVSYYIVGTTDLVYRYYLGSSWSAKDIISTNLVVSDSSMVLDSKGNPKIAVSLGSPSDATLRVVGKVNGIWMSSDVDTQSIGASISMAVDKYDRFHISYYGAGSNDLLNAVSVTSPTIPSNVNGTRGDHFVRLTWLSPASNGGSDITKYVIYRGESSGAEAYVGEVSGTSLLYNDTSVGNSNALYYKVVAVNSEGLSLASQEFKINAYSANASDDSSLMLLVIAGVVAVVAIAVVVIVVTRRVKPKGKWKQ
jgi:hypothetical protein